MDREDNMKLKGNAMTSMFTHYFKRNQALVQPDEAQDVASFGVGAAMPQDISSFSFTGDRHLTKPAYASMDTMADTTLYEGLGY